MVAQCDDNEKANPFLGKEHILPLRLLFNTGVWFRQHTAESKGLRPHGKCMHTIWDFHNEITNRVIWM